ncbi:MAG: adenosine kinase [Simkaniaceae bacterium]
MRFNYSEIFAKPNQAVKTYLLPHLISETFSPALVGEYVKKAQEKISNIICCFSCRFALCKNLIVVMTVFLHCFLSGAEYEVIVLGDPIMDLIYFVSDQALAEINVQKGSWNPVSREQFQDIRNLLGDPAKILTGGSGCNVAQGLSKLGLSCAVIGKIGNDREAKVYEDFMARHQIRCLFQKRNLPTGQACCFVTSDGERSFCTHLGAGLNKDPILIDDATLKQAQLLHMEGYQLLNKENARDIMVQAKKCGLAISLDLANVRIVKELNDFIWQLLRERWIDILFANQMEAEAFTGLPPKEACFEMSKHCRYAIVTMNDKGSFGMGRMLEEPVHVSAVAAKAVDSTGAGDYFSGGTLYGILQGMALEEAMKIGSLVASFVVGEIGAEIPGRKWKDIKDFLWAFSSQRQNRQTFRVSP